LQEASYFAKEIRKGGYTLSSVVINRALPSWLIKNTTAASPKDTSRLAAKFTQMKKYYEDRDQFYQDFAQDLIVEMKNPHFVFRIPEFDQDLANIQDIAELAQLIESEGN